MILAMTCNNLVVVVVVVVVIVVVAAAAAAARAAALAVAAAAAAAATQPCGCWCSYQDQASQAAMVATAVSLVLEAVGLVSHLARLLSQAQSLLQLRGKCFHGSSRFPARTHESHEKGSCWGLHPVDRLHGQSPLNRPRAQVKIAFDPRWGVAYRGWWASECGVS